MTSLYVIVACIAAVAESTQGACCGPASVLMSPSAYELPYPGYPAGVTSLPIKAYPYGSCPLKPCGLPQCQPCGLPCSATLPSCVPALPSSPYVLPSPPLTSVDYLSPYGSVVQANDNTVANNLANLLQMLVVTNMLGNTLPINKCNPGVPSAIPTTCGNAVYW